jgi:uncharacterized protein YgbK (DUF1537 family)
MEALVLGGISTLLFLEPPTPEKLAQFPRVQAVGLAGVSRTMTPAEMDQALPEAFASLRELGAPLAHYKVCSTFDSSPEIGSIGRATEIGRRVFNTPLAPVMVGAPKLKRFVAFGNHFATVGERTYRLDRHPTMSRHPITPMNEADLRLHLTEQTDLQIGLIDLHQLAAPPEALLERFERLAAAGDEIAVLDTLDEGHLLKIGGLLWALGQRRPLFVVGSSGVEFALADYLQSTGQVRPPQTFTSPGTVAQIIAISGSAAPKTAAQIQYAQEHGFTGIRLDSAGLINPQSAEQAQREAVQQALSALQNGSSVILYSALGPEDPQIAQTKDQIAAWGISPREAGETLGTRQGRILKEILQQTGLKRCAVAGGDTSGKTLTQLGVYALEFLIPLGTATPLCRARSHAPRLDQLEISLKGGQLGEIDFFERVVQGR